MTGHAILWRHFTVACSLIAEVADAIPEQEIEPTFRWVLRGCSRQPDNGFEEATFAKAWECVGAIAPLLQAEEANALCKVALANKMWKDASLQRTHLRHAIGPVVRLLSSEQLTLLIDNLAEQALLSAKTESDVVATVNLLVHSVEVAGEEARARVASKVFVKGQQLSWAVVCAADKLLPGKAVFVSWDKLVDGLVHDLRHQVQKLRQGDEPVKVSNSTMQYNHTRNDGVHLLVHIQSGVPYEAAIRQHRYVPKESFASLIQAMLDGVANTFNLIANRVELIELIGHSAEALTEELRKKIYSVLKPMAEGHITTDVEEMSQEEAVHPLSRFRIKSGSLADIQAVAIQTLAMIEKAYPGTCGKRLNTVIGKGLRSNHLVVQQLAIWAWSQVPHKSPAHGVILLLATRSINPKLATLALDAIGATKGATLSAKELDCVVDSCRVASMSHNPKLREAAAYCLKQFKGTPLHKESEAAASQAVSQLSGDICFSVRRAATGAD